MKKLFFLVAAFSLILSACLPTQAPATPAPTENLAATADVFVQQTLQALPTQTATPTITPVIVTPAPTDTPTQASTPTETQNPVLLTLTATLGAGTSAVGSEASQVGTSSTINGPVSSTTTPNPALGITSTGTAHPLHSGTMPPNLPFGEIKLINKSKAEAYISLRCVTKDDFVTIIEYPVKGIVTTRALAGQYTYVTWVGGRKIVGSFSLANSQDLTIKIYKDRVEIN